MPPEEVGEKKFTQQPKQKRKASLQQNPPPINEIYNDAKFRIGMRSGTHRNQPMNSFLFTGQSNAPI